MRDLGGMPLVSWTIGAARESPLTRFVVSTEDVEIATATRAQGAEVIPQPLDSALSGTKSAPVVMSALDFLRDTEGYEPDVVCCLHPTSPFRTAFHIKRALLILNELRSGVGSVITTCEDRVNGAIWMAGTESFRKYGTFFFGPIWPLPLDPKAGLDIDTWDDLEKARGLV